MCIDIVLFGAVHPSVCVKPHRSLRNMTSLYGISSSGEEQCHIFFRRKNEHAENECAQFSFWWTQVRNSAEVCPTLQSYAIAIYRTEPGDCGANESQTTEVSSTAVLH